MHMSHSAFRMVGRREEGKGEYGKRDGSMCAIVDWFVGEISKK